MLAIYKPYRQFQPPVVKVQSTTKQIDHVLALQVVILGVVIVKLIKIKILPVTVTIAAFLLFLFAGITDWLDGYLARKLLLQSHLGRILDPIADKVLVACILLALSSHYSKDWMFVVPTLAIFLREFVISGFREYMSKEGILVQVSILSKWKTTLQLISIGLIILSMIFSGNNLLTYASITLFWISAIITLKTGFDYIKSGIIKLE